MIFSRWFVRVWLGAVLVAARAAAAPDTAGTGDVGERADAGGSVGAVAAEAGSGRAAAGASAGGAAGVVGSAAGVIGDAAGAPRAAQAGAASASETIAVNRANTEEPHLLKSVRASSGLFRGAIAGGAVNLELNRAVPPQHEVRAALKRVAAPGGGAEQKPGAPEAPRSAHDPKSGRAASEGVPAEIQGFQGDSVIVALPPETPTGLYAIELFITPTGSSGAGGSPPVVPRPQYVYIRDKWFLVWIGLIPVGMVGALLAIVFSYRRWRSKGAKIPTLTSLLLLDPQNETYSLSRAQFIVWMAALGWAYVFLFAAQGFVQNVWTFPSLEGFGATFVVSLGTLLAAQTTSSMRGVKGAGEVHPSLADLFVHGGVLALERVQQVLWTVIAVGMFVYVVFKNYAEAAELPTVPKELLILMGISSLGYLGGKLARKPGPVIHRVDVVTPQGAAAAPAGAHASAVASSVSLGLKITGTTFSRDATISVDGKVLDGLVVLAPATGEFATELQVPWTPSSAGVAGAGAVDLWHASPRRVVLVNADSQRAEWEPAPSLGLPSTQRVGDSLEVTIEAHHVPDQAKWTATGATVLRAARTSRPSVWRIELQPSVGQTAGTLSVDVGNGRVLTCNWSVPVPVPVP